MSKKLFAFITGLIGVACTVVTICMNQVAQIRFGLFVQWFHHLPQTF